MSSQVGEEAGGGGYPVKEMDEMELEDEGLDGEVRGPGEAEGDDDERRKRGHAKNPSVSEKDRKIGHRRINDDGKVSYKKIESNQLMASIQLGIHDSIGGLAKYPERDLLMQDFMTVETVQFPKGGGTTTPKHSFSDFTFRTYAPVAFRYFRDLFGIKLDDFMLSICNEPMRELSNPGASGSIFYLTRDDEFILKTVMFKEAEFLQKLLAGYYMNLQQNPHTLLPKFFGMFCYHCNQKNIRLTVMNNLLPSSVKMHLKFDLKGSTYKRKASKHERNKKSPTYKDLDFLDLLPEGLLMEPETYTALISTMKRDCRVLESFKIMDYSLLVGIHNLDLAARERLEGAGTPAQGSGEGEGTQKYRQRLVAHSTAMESIQATSDPVELPTDFPPGGIPARNHKGERLLIFLGIIDILQSYRLSKKLEHVFKAMIHDGDTVSVHRPGFYAERFMNFMSGKVFRKIPSPLKHSPSKRNKTLKTKLIAQASNQHQQQTQQPPQQQSAPQPQNKPQPDGPRPDVVPDRSASHLQSRSSLDVDHGHSPGPSSGGRSPRSRYISGDVVSVSDIKLEPRVDHDTPSKLSVATTSGFPGTPAHSSRGHLSDRQLSQEPVFDSTTPRANYQETEMVSWDAASGSETLM